MRIVSKGKLTMKKRFIKENSNSDRFYLTVNLDERGEYSATLYDYDDNEVWDCDYELVSELIDDGYLKYKPDEDLDRLAEYLGSVGVIPRGSTIDPEKEESMEESRRMYSRKSGRTKLLESKLRKVIRPIVERMLREGEDDDELSKASEWGSELSEKCRWDGYLISLVYLEALTDANFHTLRKKIEPVINKYFEEEN